MVLKLLCLSALAATAKAQLDFGSGCEAGQGSFTLELPVAGATKQVGSIPKGKWNVKVRLSSPTDVDITLYDTEETSTFPGGKAIVAWCGEDACNIGVCGTDAGPCSAEYRAMGISYSGYEGEDRKFGHEWITVSGITTTSLEMSAYAFATGKAIVHYEWSYAEDGCCQGLEACGGEAEFQLEESAIATVAAIPVGKKDLRISITSPSDVDIQLYDSEDTTVHAEGKAIVAYCAEDDPDCNKGALGNGNGGAEETDHKDLRIEYSGYNGDGDNPGNEFIQMRGVTNTALSMKVFAFKAGTAKVRYSYWEPSPNLPGTFIGWRQMENHKEHHTNMFRNVPANTLIVRRAATFKFRVRRASGLSPQDVQVALVSGDGGQGDAASAYPAAALEFNAITEGATTVLVSVDLSDTAPVGVYSLELTLSYPTPTAMEPAVYSTPIYVLFNPYASGDDTYQTEAKRKEYLLNEVGLVWQGLSDNNDGFKWEYQQFDFANLDTSLTTATRRMPVADRGDAVLVSRHITYAVGQDICYGKWGDGSYTTGKPSEGYTCSATQTEAKIKGVCKEPDAWRDSSSVFELYRLVQKPVQYCQCFVYAALVTTIGRGIGLATRPVTTFQSAHDGEGNRAIEKYYEIDEATGNFDPAEGGPSHDSVWSFHVWNEVWMKRRDVDCSALGKSASCQDGWQAIDATPQETSKGGSGVDAAVGQFQMGPASIRMVKQNLDPPCLNTDKPSTGCYDNQFVISEVNSDVRLWIKDSAGTEQDGGWSAYPAGCVGAECSFKSDPWGDPMGTIGLLISTKKPGPISAACLSSGDDRTCDKDRLDLTLNYKRMENSGPGDANAWSRRLLASPMGDAAALQLELPQGLGVTPLKGSPLINTPGHPFSCLHLSLPVRNAGDASRTVYCELEAMAVDYRGDHFADTAANSIVSRQSTSLVIGPGETMECRFKIKRDAYVRFASTALDGGEAMEGKAHSIIAHVMVNVGGSQGYNRVPAFFQSHTKLLCTPQIGLTTRTGIVCEGNRGVWRQPSDAVMGVDHLTKAACAAVGKSSLTVGDGRCQQHNNVAGCYDGGDCCMTSCWTKQGQFIKSGSNGWEYSHECANIDESLDCLDPLYTGNMIYPPPDFSDPTTNLSAFTGVEPDPPTSPDCPAISTAFVDAIVGGLKCQSSCGGGSACQVALQDLYCNDDDFANFAVDCPEIVAATFNAIETATPGSSCSLRVPRCAPRTLAGCRCVEPEAGQPKCTNIGHDALWCYTVAGSCPYENPPGDHAFPEGLDWDECADPNAAQEAFPAQEAIVWSMASDNMPPATPNLPVFTTTTGSCSRCPVAVFTASPSSSPSTESTTGFPSISPSSTASPSTASPTVVPSTSPSSTASPSISPSSTASPSTASPTVVPSTSPSSTASPSISPSSTASPSTLSPTFEPSTSASPSTESPTASSSTESTTGMPTESRSPSSAPSSSQTSEASAFTEVNGVPPSAQRSAGALLMSLLLLVVLM